MSKGKRSAKKRRELKAWSSKVDPTPLPVPFLSPTLYNTARYPSFMYGAADQEETELLIQPVEQPILDDVHVTSDGDIWFFGSAYHTFNDL